MKLKLNHAPLSIINWIMVGVGLSLLLSYAKTVAGFIIILFVIGLNVFAAFIDTSDDQ